MAVDTLHRVREEAQALGIDWGDVKAAYRWVLDAEREKRAHPNQVRQAAWMMATASTPGSWPFWRHGFLSRWGQRIARGADHTIVPGYDEISQEIASEFPEYAGDDGTERLWDFLLSPYDRLPSREDLYLAALDLVASHQHKESTQ